MTVSRVNFDRLPGFLARVDEAVNAGVTAAARTHSNIVRASFSRGGRYGPGSPRGTPPNVRRGWLRNNCTYSVSTNFRAVSGVRAIVPYARIHELGGTIRPVRAKNLTVPVNAQAMRISELGGVRSIKTFSFRSRRGNTIIMGRAAKTVSTYSRGFRVVDRGQPVWVLKPSINMPPRPYLRPALVNNRAAIHRASMTAARAVLRRAA